jgi:hypothetical protein
MRKLPLGVARGIPRVDPTFDTDFVSTMHKK